MSPTSSVSEPRVLSSGLAYVESPRWHDGRLWFAHWGTQEIVAVDLDGKRQVVGHGGAQRTWPPKKTCVSVIRSSRTVSTSTLR